MIFVCAGMYRSGSTWQYQVVCELVRRAGWQAKPLGFLHGAQLAEFISEDHDPKVVYIYKTHNPELLNLSLHPLTVRTFYSWRDLRDVAYSMAHKIGTDFWKATRETRFIEQCIAADAFWRAAPNVLGQQYEIWVRDNLPFVRRIAAHAGVKLPEDVLQAVAEEFALERNRTRAEELTLRLMTDGVDLSDPANVLSCDSDSLLHWNHIRTGSVGSWRKIATAEELAYLAATCGEWLVEYGYESDDSWARETIA